MTPKILSGMFGMAAAISMMACSQQASPTSGDSSSSPRISGWLLEKLDHPPYSYLRLKTDTAELWAAVPVAHVDREQPVTVLNAVALKNYSVGSTGRRFDVIYFGVLQPPPGRP